MFPQQEQLAFFEYLLCSKPYAKWADTIIISVVQMKKPRNEGTDHLSNMSKIIQLSSLLAPSFQM